MECIDIIMPAYNCEGYVRDAIQSVKDQTFTNWKLIIVEDASTDGTRKEIEDSIKEIKEKVIFLPLNKNIGPAGARNKGLEKVESRYIAFMDADDRWHKEKLEKQRKWMEENYYAFTYTLYTYCKEGREKEVHYFPRKLNYRKALKNTFILTSTVMLDTKQIEKKNIEMPEIASEDTATWWNILKKGTIAHGLKENLVYYLVNNKGLSSNKFTNLKRTWNLYRKQQKLNIVKTIYCFGWYVFYASLKRII